MYRDTRGYLWVGTPLGLNRCDGSQVEVYLHSRRDKQSIANNFVSSIAGDDSGFLWLSTKAGVSKFNPFLNTAVNFYSGKERLGHLPSDFNTRIFVDRGGAVWLCSEAGLALFDRNTQSFETVEYLPPGLTDAKVKSVGKVFEDSKGRFWIGSYDGLVLYDRKHSSSVLYVLDSTKRLGENAVTSIFEDHEGNIWAGIWGKGICIVDVSGKKLRSFIWNRSKSFPGTVNLSFAMEETVNSVGVYSFWLGTSEGLKRFNFPSRSALATGEWYQSLEQQISQTPFIPNSSNTLHGFRGRNVSCMFKDRTGILWLGTEDGINAYLPDNERFQKLSMLKGMVTNLIPAVLQQRECYLVTAWYGQGFTLLDSNQQIRQKYLEIPPTSNKSVNRQVSDVVTNGNGEVWIGTMNGLYLFNLETSSTKAFLHNKNNSQSVSSNRIISLGKDDSGQIWIGTYDKGLDVYNPKTGHFRHFQKYGIDNTTPANILVWRIQNLGSGILALCTNDGLSLYNQKNGLFTNFIDSYSRIGFSGNIVSGVVSTPDGELWIGTDKGLNRLDPTTGRFEVFTHEDGLKDDNILALTMDQFQRIWLVTRRCITSFDTKNFQVVNYDENAGLPSGDLVGPIILDFQNNLLVGAYDGLVKLVPGREKDTSEKIEVFFQKLWISGRLYHYNGPLEQAKTIVLSYPQNNFSCSFDAPAFFTSSPIHYRYQLKGLNSDWIDAGTRNFVSYANLAAGNYVFQVDAQEQNGQWSQSIKQIEFKVLPPFWETWWFRISLILLIGSFCYLVIWLRIRNVRRIEALKAKLGSQMSELRLKAMRSRMNPHFMFNSLNSIQECIYTGNTKAAYKYLSKFSKLVRLILERSDQMLVSIQQEMEMLVLYLDLESLRFHDTFSYQMNLDEAAIEALSIPPMLIQPFAENALWHGLARKVGAKMLEISFQTKGDFLIVRILDNGIGRKASERFSTETTSYKQHSLGLKLVEEQLEVVSKLSGKPAQYFIQDLISDDGSQSLGTLVEISVPIIDTFSTQK